MAVFVKRRLNQKGGKFILPSSFVFLAQLILFESFVQGAPEYTIIDLGTLGGDLSVAKALNEKGHVVGYSRTAANDTDMHAFVYKDGKMTDLGTLGGKSSKAHGINNAGVVVGESDICDKKYHHGFVYKDGVMKDLGTLGGDWCTAMDVNEQGVIVGSSSNSEQNTRAFLYQDNKMLNLGILAGLQSSAEAINEKGQITGQSTYSTEHLDMHAFIYDQGKMKDINPAGNESYAYDINNKGEITGWRRVSNMVCHPFIYAHGKLTEFETLGGKSAAGSAINDHSQIVGESEDKKGNRRAFLYEDGKTIDLNTLIESEQWILYSARDINNKGQITGHGSNAKGEEHAFLMTPVTE